MSTVDIAAELGLDPRGWHAPGTETYIPWDAPASELADPDDPGDFAEPDPSYTVLDHLTDLAGAQGMGLQEYLEADEDAGDDPEAVDGDRG